MTPAELAQVEEAKAVRPRATKGPWYKCGCGSCQLVYGDGGKTLIHSEPDYTDGPPADDEEGMANATMFAASDVLTRRVVELEEQLKRYEWTLAETEALVMSHEGHIAKQDAQIAKLKEWQGKAVDWVCEAKVVVAEQAEMWKGRPREEEYNRQLDEITTLIAQAQEGGEGI